MLICAAEFPNELDRYESAIEGIIAHVKKTNPDLLVLPEMPFTPWIFSVEIRNPDHWKAAVESHAKWLDHLAKAISTPMIASRPIDKDCKALNQAFYLDSNRQLHPLREKSYLPNEFPTLERVWFNEGDKPIEVFNILEQKIGVQLCSEIMYSEIPRQLAEKGADIIIQPRASGGHPRWRAASLLAGCTAGAFVVGSNRRSADKDWFTGVSWIYSPTGELLGESTPDNPFVTVEIDLNIAHMAKSEYPLTMYNHYQNREN